MDCDHLNPGIICSDHTRVWVLILADVSRALAMEQSLTAGDAYVPSA